MNKYKNLTNKNLFNVNQLSHQNKIHVDPAVYKYLLETVLKISEKTTRKAYVVECVDSIKNVFPEDFLVIVTFRNDSK